MCRVLGVSPSGYYAWRRREPSPRSVSDAQLTALIGQVHRWSRGTYGVPRMVRELRARGPHVNPKRVARLMREAGLQGVPKGLDASRSYPRITPEQAAIACRRLAHRIEGGIDSYMESEILTRALWSPARASRRTTPIRSSRSTTAPAGPTRQDRRPLARALPGGRDRRVRPGPARATPWTTDSAPAT